MNKTLVYAPQPEEVQHHPAAKPGAFRSARSVALSREMRIIGIATANPISHSRIPI